MPNSVYIIKANGKKEIFDENKLFNSLKRAGASKDISEEITGRISKSILEGESTEEIYKRAFEILEEDKGSAVIKYSLRKALMDLGPTGFPFENFIAEIFRKKGFEVKTDVILRGKCVEHEMDVVAWNKQKLIMTEVKFHNQRGIKSDLKVALYVKARFDDLAERKFNYGKERDLDERWLITNTKFSTNAIKYSECSSINLVGWSYPVKGNLQDMVEETGVHPLTCIKGLTSIEKRELLDSGIISCKQAVENTDILRQVGMNDKKIAKIIKETRNIQ